MIHLPLDNCVVRSLAEGDAESIAHFGNNPKIAGKMRDVFPSPYLLDNAKVWIAMVLSANNKDWVNAIEVDGKAVGVVSVLFKNDIYKNSAEIGYWIGEPFWNKGIVGEAVKGLVAYTLQNTDLVRLYGEVFDNNPASAKVLEKAGLTYECTHKKAVTKNGELMDSHIYTLIR